MKKRVICFTFLLALFGCSQFESRPPTKPTTPVLVAPVKTEVAPEVRTVMVVDKVVVTKQKDVGCDVLDAPKHPPLPTAPDAKHGEVLTDHQKLLLMQSYIWNLREYIADEQSAEDKTYQNYAKACVHPPAAASSVSK